MHDAGSWRHHAKGVEGFCAPTQEFVAFAVAFELALGVVGQCKKRAKAVDLHGMIDHEVHRDLRVDQSGIAPQARHCGAHRRKVYHHWRTGKVLQYNASRFERELALIDLFGVPVGQPGDVVFGHRKAVHVA